MLVFTNIGDLVMDKVTKDEYLRALEIANQDDDLNQIDKDESDGDLSEAERLAAHADAPTLRVDGRPVGSPLGDRPKPMTAAMTLFAQGLIQGKTYRQAYRDAYPQQTGSDSTITTSAYKLSRDARVQALVADALDETAEHLAEDMASTKRYVMRQLVAHSKTAKQEGTKLKALELLGKASGLFTQADADKGEVVTAEQLKRELGAHLKLVKASKAMPSV
jgi:predicted transcriptional regulator